MINIWQLKEQENIAIDDENLMQSITGLIKTSTKNNLELAELLLNTAKDLSRNTDFTKADAYQGLARVYELKLKYQKYNLTDTEKQELEDKVSLVIQKSHLIHQKLNKEK